MTTLSATSRVRCPHPVELGHTIAQHLAEHGSEVSSLVEKEWLLASQNGSARLIADTDSLHMEASAPDTEKLMEMKYLLASHVGEFNGKSGVDIVWRGDGDEIATLPNLRTLKVEAVQDLSTHIRRITFRSSELKRFDTLSALHAKLLLPRDGASLVLPRLSAWGTTDWGTEAERAYVRKYTIRRIDVVAGTLDIDFVLHTHGGPGSRFAMNAKAGDAIGMIGPGGGAARPADWNLFVGDETALPAIARLVEALPAEARGIALIEVADEGDEQEICQRAAVDVHWLHRNTRLRNDLLAERALSIDIPRSGSLFAWAGTEFDAFRTIRSDWRSSKRMVKNEHLAVAYWRQGLPQT